MVGVECVNIEPTGILASPQSTDSSGPETSSSETAADVEGGSMRRDLREVRATNLELADTSVETSTSRRWATDSEALICMTLQGHVSRHGVGSGLTLKPDPDEVTS